MIRVVLCALFVLTAPRVAAQNVVASQSAIKSFLGGQGGLLFFVDKADGGKLKYVDINDSSLAIKTLDSGACRDPRISLDGTRVAYGIDGKIYARDISGGDRVEIASVGTARSKGVGYWYSSGGSDYIIYCSSTEKYEYNTGKTYKQKINGIQKDGSPVEIYDKAYDGGITPDGKWIGEAYGERHAYNLSTSKEYLDFFKADNSKEGQCCNGSMAPMTGPYRMVTLVLPHDYFRSWQYDSGQDRWEEYKTYTKPSDTVEWQSPEWSLHKDYITVTADDGGYDLYIQNANDPSKRLKVIDGDISTSHLYVGSTGPQCVDASDCDDSDACTTDSCDGGSCKHVSISGCCNQATECGDSDACTADSCDSHSCKHDAISGCCKGDAECDDSDLCTTDKCSSNACSYEAVAGCCTTDSDCSDSDPCTADSCKTDNSCQHDAVSGCCTKDAQCDDTTVCTADSCGTDNSCSYSPVAGCCGSDADCADNNPCTTDSCDQSSGNCSNATVDGCCAVDTDCDDSDICTTNSCGVDGSCANASISGCCTEASGCDDGDPCTTESCDANSCSNKPIAGCCGADTDCDDNNPCSTDSCDDTSNTCTATAVSGCCTEDSQCDDGTDCTANNCGADNACAYTPLPACCHSDADCVDTNPCTEDRCVIATGECEYAAVGGCCTVDTDCDDGDGCTADSCDLTSSSCNHEALSGCDEDPGGLPAKPLGKLVGGCSIDAEAVPLPALLLFALLLYRRRNP